MNHYRSLRTGTAHKCPGLLISTFLTVLLFAPAAGAGNGRLEINQACALDGGCFQGDDPGFPVQITQPGSYLLTGNLDLSEAAQPESTHAVFIEADDVSIDLAGFTILGTNECSLSDLGPVTDCDNEGFANGITGQLGRRSIEIRNGTIRGMTSWGVSLAGTGVQILDLLVRHNGEGGVAAGENSVVGDVTALENGGVGVTLLEDGFVHHVRSGRNAQHGTQVGDGSLISRSIAVSNNNDGFRITGSGQVRASHARFNLDSGVYLADQSSVIDSVLSGNQVYGVQCETSGAVQGSSFDTNELAGIDSDCVEIGTNLCDGDTNCL